MPARHITVGVRISNNAVGRKRMLSKALAIAATLLLSAQVYVQTNQAGSPGPAQGVTSGPAAGSLATMKSPQAGPLATKHQRNVLRHHGQSASSKSQASGGQRNDETSSTGSSSPPTPRHPDNFAEA
jgi:hypothetical protein